MPFTSWMRYGFLQVSLHYCSFDDSFSVSSNLFDFILLPLKQLISFLFLFYRTGPEFLVSPTVTCLTWQRLMTAVFTIFQKRFSCGATYWTTEHWWRNYLIANNVFALQAENFRCGNGIPEPGEQCDCGTPEVNSEKIRVAPKELDLGWKTEECTLESNKNCLTI